ncbi:type II toxin-antitoxin system RelB/DinJ family antitoxin [Adlercreutzia faecimuris]|uniref:Type II toxin-antitoxin system RelB/DinJ family antitoxin n=1 Tax=Adlercreutzia faecimuris TaxID=2897341 RepID=A0ABS9WGL4_9ACTN|nr:type II toxin-antitoxin system RelB/DinJ family antitoxin [Adlercreutzia sp. JBNU-10]MCI2241925.1 type II toxin-antitoxin system RelB/DinJ family antitoxin [Adlercreutzia sp. JBNU-10]
MVSVQMNTRIDGAVKERGDRALAAAGLNPSQVVRAVWAFAARNEGRPQAMRDLMGELGESLPAPEKQTVAQEGWSIVGEGLARLGVPAPPRPASGDLEALYDGLRADALDERLAKWGLR